MFGGFIVADAMSISTCTIIVLSGTSKVATSKAKPKVSFDIALIARGQAFRQELLRSRLVQVLSTVTILKFFLPLYYLIVKECTLENQQRVHSRC